MTQREQDGYPQRGRGRREKRQGCGVFVLVLLLCALTAAVVFAWLFMRAPLYSTCSLSEEAAARAYAWLSRIEDMPLSYQEIKVMMDGVELKAELVPAEQRGEYVPLIEEEAYAYCLAKAKLGLENAYRETLKHRIAESGYSGEVSDALLDEVMEEAYGLTVSDYLAQCDVQLLPEREELSMDYFGGETLWLRIKSLLPQF